MRKTLLAKSIAVVGAFGLASAAQAIVLAPTALFPAGAQSPDGAGGFVPPATVLEVNAQNVGHMLAVPYYSVQNNNNTLLTLTNTDMRNGKAVKVRFRGARNSDDVFDFTILMSPGDVWTAAVSRSADGRAQLATSDKSCTLPANVNQPFVTARLPGASDAERNAGTREGYVEIFNMADIPPTTLPVAPAPINLYNAIKHTSAGVPANCAAAAITTTLRVDPANEAAVGAAGLAAPTTGLTAGWIILNNTTAAAWSGVATAIEARTQAAGEGVPGAGAVVFFPQTSDPVTLANARLWTADPLLRGGAVDNATAVGNPTVGVVGTTAPVSPASYDFPDFSTPYLNASVGNIANGVAVRQQAFALSRAFAVSSVSNEFVTLPSIAAKTDWVFSSPTRRYNVGRWYAGGTPAGTGLNLFTNYGWDDQAVSAAVPNVTVVPNVAASTIPPSNFFTAANTNTQSGVICVIGLAFAGGASGAGAVANSVATGSNLISGVTANREEGYVANDGGFVISPGNPADPLSLCGEVSVLSFNASGLASVLGGELTRKDVTAAIGGAQVTEGWARIATPGIAAAANGFTSTNGLGFGGTYVPSRQGLPVIGAALLQLTNGAVAAGVSGNYGLTLPHRGTRY